LIGERPSYPLANLFQLPDGRRVEWEATGTGPPLLWIEGGPGLPAHLARPDVSLVSDRFRAHLVNAPACGRTSAPATADGYELDAHAQFFGEVRQALGLGPLTVMGHSWGVLVALGFALAKPDAVERLILISGYAGDASVSEDIATHERERALDRVRREPWFDMAWTRFGEDLDVSGRELDERFEACWPLYFATPQSEASQMHIARLAQETRWNVDAVRAWTPEPSLDLLPHLGQIRCPTLVIAGEHDFICGPAWNRPIATAIPGATYSEIPGVGHFPQYEAPEAVRTAILAWLATQG